MPRARDGLSVSRVQDFAEKALVPKLDSYKLIYLYLFTDSFMKISLQSSEQILDDISTISMPYIQHFGRMGSLNVGIK